MKAHVCIKEDGQSWELDENPKVKVKNGLVFIETKRHRLILPVENLKFIEVFKEE